MERIIDVCNKNKIALLEGFMYQFHSQHKFVNDYIRSNNIGNPILFEARFGFPPLKASNYRYSKSEGGGALFDAGVYTIHAARNFFKREPIDLFGIINNGDFGIDDGGSILMDFGQNQIAQLSFGFNNYYQNNYTIWCTDGLLKVNRAFSIPIDLKPEIIIECNNSIDKKELEPSNQFLNEIDYFSDIIRSKIKRKPSYHDAQKQATVLQSIIDKCLN